MANLFNQKCYVLITLINLSSGKILNNIENTKINIYTNVQCAWLKTYHSRYF